MNIFGLDDQLLEYPDTMDETEQDEGRPESANSENGSENGFGFVEVTQEDAKMASQSLDDPSSLVPALDDDEDLYGGADSGDEVLQESGEGDGAGEAAVGLEEEKVRETRPRPWVATFTLEYTSLVGVQLSKHTCSSVDDLLLHCLNSMLGQYTTA